MTAVGSTPGPAFGSDLPEPRPDLVAPGSPLHQMLCDAVFGVYFVPLFLVPLLHPATADSTGRHDPAFTPERNDPIAFARRFRDTLEMISGLVYATDERDEISESVRELHRFTNGTLPDGSTYHAWNREIWSWNWAAICAAILDLFDGIRGFPDDEFRDGAYRGLLEVGRRFNVRGLPTTYAEFAAMWPAERDRVADDTTPTYLRVAQLVQPGGLDPIGPFRSLPRWTWDLATLPVRHVQRVGMYVTLPAEYHERAGLAGGRGRRLAVRVHVAAWRLVPRVVSHRLGRATLAARRRHATPVWRTRFSAETLASIRAARRETRERGSGVG